MDREKVVKAYECCKNSFDRICEKCPYEKDCCHDGIPMFVIKKMVALLKEQEAKTGTWIEKTDYMGDTYYDCSVCGESWTTIDGTPWQNGMNYCPHCGAKMTSKQRYERS